MEVVKSTAKTTYCSGIYDDFYFLIIAYTSQAVKNPANTTCYCDIYEDF